MPMLYVYILKCSDNSFYIGVTNNVQKRLWEHNNSVVKGYTSKRIPVDVVYLEEYSDPSEAIRREKQLKGWSRKKKIALIEKNVEGLQMYSKSHPSTSSG